VRLYGQWSAYGFTFDNITLNGTVVPEPSSLLLLSAGGYG
jgi:hypothetical protein